MSPVQSVTKVPVHSLPLEALAVALIRLFRTVAATHEATVCSPRRNIAENKPLTCNHLEEFLHKERVKSWLTGTGTDGRT